MYRAIASIVFLASMTSWPATAQEPGMTLLDVARIRTVGQAAASPDGKWVAFTVSVQQDIAAGDNGSAFSELHVLRVADGTSRAYVGGKVRVSTLAWKPDSSGVSYLSKRGDDQNTDLYFIPVDGGESTKLIDHDQSISAYAWDPQGARIAFLATEKEPGEKKTLREKGFDAEAYEEDLQPVRIWVNQVGSDQKPRMLELEGSASEIHWSPDGTRLVAAIAPTPLIDHFYMYRRIRVIDPDAGKVVTKIANPGKLGEIAWSPDGRRLAFLSGEDINDPSEGRLMVADSTDGSFAEVMKSYLPNVIDIDWKDNRTIRFLAHSGCDAEAGEVSAGGGEPVITVAAGGPIFESVSFGAGMAAWVAHRPSHPAEVYVSREGRAPERATNHSPWLDSRAFARQEVVEYKARDGVMVQGVLVYPLEHKPGQRYPLILTVHGGPESHISNGWVTGYSRAGQVGAARGFAVFYPNYRGSTGRGVWFAKNHQSDYGGREFNDLLDGVDHLVRNGLVERSKVGVTGGSYGGFASAWCATRHSEHFAASVMFVGISDQISKSGTTDIPDEMFHVHARKRIWDDWDFFLKRSPIYYVEKARTPILILHGKEDTRVHPSQSMELYRNLKILNKTPVRLVWYPGEGHGNRKAAARYDYSLRLMRWMEHYLKGQGGEMPAFELDYGLKSGDAKPEEK